MVSGDVKTRMPVSYEQLEKAILKAAEDIGWKAKPKDKFDKKYMLGAVNPNYKNISLRKGIFPMMTVRIYGKGHMKNFYVTNIGSLASDRKVKDYSIRVLRNLDSL